MVRIEERVNVFLEIWAKRKAGEIAAPDLTVSCESCGVPVVGDNALRFTARGLICKECLDKGGTWNKCP